MIKFVIIYLIACVVLTIYEARNAIDENDENSK